jgi:hypothetical protein
MSSSGALLVAIDERSMYEAKVHVVDAAVAKGLVDTLDGELEDVRRSAITCRARGAAAKQRDLSVVADRNPE